MNLMKNMMSLVGLALVAGTLALSATAATETVADRVKPIGDVCMAGDPCAAATVAGAGGEERSAESIYSSKCMACHTTGAAGAPKLGDASEWQQRLAARGLEGVYSNAINGFKGMPAKGMCMDCTDEEIKEVVDYILEESK